MIDWIIAWVGTEQGLINCPIQPDSTQQAISAAMEAFYHYNTDDYWIEMGGERISELETETDFHLAIWRHS